MSTDLETRAGDALLCSWQREFTSDQLRNTVEGFFSRRSTMLADVVLDDEVDFA